MSFLARGLSNLVGLVVPIVQSFKILKRPTNKKLTQSVHYWSVYGSFLIADWFLTTFFISCFIPFYDFFVLCFTVLMAVPQIGFAAMLYSKFLAPFLRKYERRIDRFTAKISEKVWEKMPNMAVSIPAALHSFLAAIMEQPVDDSDSSPEIRRLPPIQNMRLQKRNNTFEMQSDDNDDDAENAENDENDENAENDDFQILPRRSISVKNEVAEEADVVEEDRPFRALRALRSRRAARSQSVL